MRGQRGSKRPSSASSYTSTITTIVFITMCVLGVWMLTGNNLGPPRETAAKLLNDLRAQTTTAATKITNAATTTTTRPFINANTNTDQQSNTVYEDNPGNLPEDAIQPDDPKKNENAEVVKEDGNSAVSKGGDLSVDEIFGNDGDKSEKGEEEEKHQVDKKKQVMTPKEKKNREKKREEEKIQQMKNLAAQIAEEEDKKQKAQQQQIQNQVNPRIQNQQNTLIPEQIQNQQEPLIPEVVQNQKNPELIQNQKNLINPELIQNQENPLNPEEIQNQVNPQMADEIQNQINPQMAEEIQNPQMTEEIQNQINPLQNQINPQMPEPIQNLENAQFTQNQEEMNTDLPAIQNKARKRKQDRGKRNKPEKTTNMEEAAVKTGIPKESAESKNSWATQEKQSANEKERREDQSRDAESLYGYTWRLCNESTGADFIPCLDNTKALKKLRSTRHYEHRERHCPEEGPTCLVPVPRGYKRSITWPKSRDKIWYSNVPYSSLAGFKGHQNWVKVSGEFLTFPGGGTQFIHGALHYIDHIQKAVPDIAWGMRTRVVLDVGCGVASFGGYLFDRDVLTMSFAPKDEHEAQVQFALERGIPAISAVMGTQRLPFPSGVFDLLHCARCRVPWHIEGGKLLLELNRVLRPGGFFVWSATPVYQKIPEDTAIWKAMSVLTKKMCWELVTIKMDKLNSVGFAIYRKPRTNECYEKRKTNDPPMCKPDDDPNAAWYVPLQACLHRLNVNTEERGTQWPERWPLRLQAPPYWLKKSQMGIYGKPGPEDFAEDYNHWRRVVSTTYLNELGFGWENVRNIMDMRAVYGGFAAALKEYVPAWVMNVVNIDSPDTLPMIYERGLLGIYHDWCESFSTYPRTYDLLHADHLFSKLKKKCRLAPVMAEVDRIVRPGGKIIVRDESDAIGEVENLLKSLHWKVHLTFSKDQEGILSAQKGNWRPQTIQPAS